MVELNLPPIAAAAESLALRNHVVMPRLVEPKHAQVLALAARILPRRRVVCGIPHVSWDEQSIGRGHMLGKLFARQELLGYVTAALAQGTLTEEPSCWTSGYGEGEYINEHRDAAGAVQLLMSLEAPPPGHGGELRFGAGGSLGAALLAPGDAVLFLASATTHSTTPLRATEQAPAPRRVVAVARYFKA